MMAIGLMNRLLKRRKRSVSCERSSVTTACYASQTDVGTTRHLSTGRLTGNQSELKLGRTAVSMSFALSTRSKQMKSRRDKRNQALTWASSTLRQSISRTERISAFTADGFRLLRRQHSRTYSNLRSKIDRKKKGSRRWERLTRPDFSPGFSRGRSQVKHLFQSGGPPSGSQDESGNVSSCSNSSMPLAEAAL